MPSRDFSAVSDAELLAEIEHITRELVAMGERPAKISGFEKLDWSVGLGLAVTGVAAGAPITPIGLVLSGLGVGWLGFNVLRRLARQMGKREQIARIEHLTYAKRCSGANSGAAIRICNRCHWRSESGSACPTGKRSAASAGAG